MKNIFYFIRNNKFAKKWDQVTAFEIEIKKSFIRYAKIL